MATGMDETYTTSKCNCNYNGEKYKFPFRQIPYIAFVGRFSFVIAFESNKKSRLKAKKNKRLNDPVDNHVKISQTFKQKNVSDRVNTLK